MLNKKGIIKNISFMSFGEIISSLLSFFLVIFIARLLGSEGLGIYSFSFAFVGLFVVFYDFGLSPFLVREVANNKKNIEKYFGNYVTLKLIFCIISMLLPLISILFLKRSLDAIIIVYLAAIAIFFQNYSFVARTVFQAYQMMQYDALIKILERIIAFLLGLYILFAGFGLKAFLIVLIFSSLISFIISILLLKKINVKFKFQFDYIVWKRMLKISWPFWLSVVFMQIYFQVDTVMLSFIKGDEATGLYNAAYKLINIIGKVPLIVVVALFPAMSEFYASRSSEILIKTLEKGAHLMTMLSLPLITGTVILADRIIHFIYREGFQSSIFVLQILIFAVFFMFLSHLIGWFLNAVHMQKMFTYSTGICLIINITLNLLLIPYFSYYGASIATVFTLILNFALLYYFNIKSGYSINLLKLMLKPFVSSIIMGVFIFFFGDKIHLLILVPLSAFIYFLLLAISGDIKKEDFQHFLD